MNKENEIVEKLLSILNNTSCVDCPLWNRCEEYEGRYTICDELKTKKVELNEKEIE